MRPSSPAVLLLPLLAAACAGPSERFESPEALERHAVELCRSALLVDTHIDVPIRLYGQGEQRDDEQPARPRSRYRRRRRLCNQRE